ncbi:hypothetical protein JTB14_013855 [Gonioctena quinquepunctata]|nr:hypothetical protein JTB14_013855 [Gonioctena quinquepunctata]
MQGICSLGRADHLEVSLLLSNCLDVDIEKIPMFNLAIEKRALERYNEMEPQRKRKETFPALPKLEGSPPDHSSLPSATSESSRLVSVG